MTTPTGPRELYRVGPQPSPTEAVIIAGVRSRVTAMFSHDDRPAAIASVADRLGLTVQTLEDLLAAEWTVSTAIRVAAVLELAELEQFCTAMMRAPGVQADNGMETFTLTSTSAPGQRDSVLVDARRFRVALLLGSNGDSRYLVGVGISGDGPDAKVYATQGDGAVWPDAEEWAWTCAFTLGTAATPTLDLPGRGTDEEHCVLRVEHGMLRIVDVSELGTTVFVRRDQPGLRLRDPEPAGAQP
jgi:hypothetical protein